MRNLILSTLLVFASLSASAATVDEKIDALASELAAIKESLAGPGSDQSDQQYAGMGKSASKVYFSKSPLSIGGYGEVVFQNIQGESGDTADALRFVPYFGYRFSDKIILNAEIEIEHANEIFLEFGYLDFLLAESFNVRTGLVLVPVGIVNYLHEPTLFPSVNRSEVEKNIIPSTWRENGLLVYGRVGAFEYTAGAVTSFDLTNGLSSSSWLRSGREKGSKAKATDWSGVARLDFTGVDGLIVGGSIYSGEANHQNTSLGGARVTIWDAHLMYNYRALKFKALYTQGALSFADLVSTAAGATIGEETEGYYAEASYNIMPLVKPTTSKEWNLFVRHEQYDTNKKVGNGFTRDETLDKTRTLVGMNYLPHSNVILKTNWVFRKNASADEADLWEFGAGYIF